MATCPCGGEIRTDGGRRVRRCPIITDAIGGIIVSVPETTCAGTCPAAARNSIIRRVLIVRVAKGELTQAQAETLAAAAGLSLD